MLYLKENTLYYTNNGNWNNKLQSKCNVYSQQHCSSCACALKLWLHINCNQRQFRNMFFFSFSFSLQNSKWNWFLKKSNTNPSDLFLHYFYERISFTLTFHRYSTFSKTSVSESPFFLKWSARRKLTVLTIKKNLL